jgi:hypothetical protein
MKPNSISTAFDHVDVDASPTFRDNLRAQFVAAMAHPEQDQTIGNRAEDGVTVAVIEAPSVQPEQQRRQSIIVGIAAAIIVIAVLAAVVLTRPSNRASVGPSDDSAIAESALMTEQQLKGWTVLDVAGSTSQMGDIAEGIPACAPYVDYAFDSKGRDAVTKERDFRGAYARDLVQLVYIFPTEAAATEAMNKIAEPGFVPCFNAFIDNLTAVGGALKSDTTTAEAPTFASHGDRQVVLPQTLALRLGSTFTVVSFLVQVGRGIVYVDPLLLWSDPLDSKGTVGKTVAAATDALAAALR